MTRGEGERQKKDRQFTTSKVIAYLTVSPFTYQQLQNESKIQRQTLRQILDSLVMQKVVKKHRFTIQNDPHIEHNSTYYLVDWSKNKIEPRQLLQYYFNNNNNKSIEKVRHLTSKDIMVKDTYEAEARKTLNNLTTFFDKNYERLSYEEHKEFNIVSSKLVRRLDFASIKNQCQIDYHEPSKDEVYNALKLINFCLERKYHLLDAVIKACVDDKIAFGLYRYIRLWDIMEKARYFPFIN